MYIPSICTYVYFLSSLPVNKYCETIKICFYLILLKICNIVYDKYNANINIAKNFI